MGDEIIITLKTDLRSLKTDEILTWLLTNRQTAIGSALTDGTSAEHQLWQIVSTGYSALTDKSGKLDITNTIVGEFETKPKKQTKD